MAIVWALVWSERRIVLHANVKLRYLRPKFAKFSKTTGTERKRRTSWRRRWDSNPRGPFGPNGFQDRRLQPLGHPSEIKLFEHCNLQPEVVTILPYFGAPAWALSPNFDRRSFAVEICVSVRIVTLMLECPSNSLTVTLSTPLPTRREAKVWRSVCHVTPEIPAFLQARANPAFKSTNGLPVSGL